MSENNEKVINFLEKFANKKANSKKVKKDTLFGFSLNNYKAIEKETDLLDRVDFLNRIADSIKSKVITKVDIDLPNKKFKIDYKGSLNHSQYLAVVNTEGPVLVIAGAGSGKTRTIVYRVAYLLENNVPPEKILLLTFTKRSSKEMLDRTSILLQDESCNRVMGGTFHSFANHILRKYHKLIDIPGNFTIVDNIDSGDIIDLIRQELGFAKQKKAFPQKRRVSEIISKSRNCNLPIREIILREFSGLEDFIPDIETISDTYKQYKKGNNIFDYDDLLEFLRDSLRDKETFRKSVQKLFSHIMVDEFQDTNIVQKDIVDLITNESNNLMVVGDDAQSIYSFRGANVENILTFPNTYPEAKIVMIEENYRSSQEILDFTNSIIDSFKIGFKKELFSTKEKNVKPKLLKYYDQQDEANFIVDKVLALREEGIPLSDMSILYRAGYHGNYIQTELLRRKIPYVVYGGLKFTERRHVKDLISYLRVALNPYDAVAWNRTLKLIPGIGNNTASKIINSIKEDDGDFDINKYSKRKFFWQLEKLKKAVDLAQKENLNISNKVELLTDYYKPLLKDLEADHKKRFQDLEAIYTLACKYEKLEKFLSDFALDPPSHKFQDETAPKIDETEEKPLVLSTIHSAKGLEWNTVFVPHLLDGLFPSAQSLKKFNDFEEERRLFYVACTRAKENLFISLPSFVYSWDKSYTMPSRFLIELEQNKYTTN